MCQKTACLSYPLPYFNQRGVKALDGRADRLEGKVLRAVVGGAQAAGAIGIREKFGQGVAQGGGVVRRDQNAHVRRLDDVLASRNPGGHDDQPVTGLP